MASGGVAGYAFDKAGRIQLNQDSPLAVELVARNAK
jgi:hypothetical protein